MLGTNDCKTRFALTASDVAAGVRELANRISRELPAKFARFTREIGCDYLDLGPIASVSEKDGIHLDPDQHQKVAEAVVAKIREILG